MIPLDQSAFMTTYTGRKFYLFDPSPNDVDIVDIAHALSQLCRFTGHCREFYSVAEHCINAATLATEADALAALLHDAAEAYINDLSRPLKHDPRLVAYLETEARIEQAIATRFGLSSPIKNAAIDDIDKRLVCSEGLALMADATWAVGHPKVESAYWRIRSWAPKEAEGRYLMIYDALTR